MIDAQRLLVEMQAQQKKLEADLRQQITTVEGLNERLETEYKAARDANRTGDTFGAWCDNEITQAAVAWLLGCVFLRFCEDNGLLTAPLLAGPAEANRRARDAAREYFQQHPTDNDRHWLLHAFGEMARFPAVAGLYRADHNPLYRMPISADAGTALLAFWQAVNPDSGALLRDFTDSALDTRFLGDLYQDLSESARRRYALLQTPLFVEEFILDRTLDPAIQTFGLEQVRMIDPTCGSGHFLLGGFARINALYEKQGMEPRERVMRSLAAVYGVDLNPFAVAIARFRLLVASLQATGIRTLKEAPGWRFNLTIGDSLLHGRRFAELDLGADDLTKHYAHCFFTEDREEIDRILGQQYHAVVGNPPYITVKDAALNALYRTRYQSCHMQYSLGVPFTERFIQLAVSTENQLAGYVGLITTNSFMKREFGKKLIEEYLPRQDLTHVIDTSGAHIPGHGTPTVILFARHRRPVGNTLRAVQGIRGEPSAPDDAALGLVWRSIVDSVDHPGSMNDFVSASDIARATLSKHPWSMQGGGANELKDRIEEVAPQNLVGIGADIGFLVITGEDNCLLLDCRVTTRQGLTHTRVIGDGECVRDWTCQTEMVVLWPNTSSGERLGTVEISKHLRYLWPFRTSLKWRKAFGTPVEQKGIPWWGLRELYASRLDRPLTISYAEVATHNHFVLDRSGTVFKQTAPVIKLPANTNENLHLELLGLLNSSTALFWMRQNCHNKGAGGIGGGIATEEWERRLAIAGSRLAEFPLPTDRPMELGRKLDQLASARAAGLPLALAARFPMSRTALNEARHKADSLLATMIAAQEELDWWCYRAYGLLDQDLTYVGTLPELKLGERAFEIVMARKVLVGDLKTAWFERHGSTPITELPEHWSADYAQLVQRRIAAIESHPWISLLEKPEYKRRWNQPNWVELEQSALQAWVLDRLESVGYWPESALQSVDELAARAERDADCMTVAAQYAGQEGFDLRPLLVKLLADESVPALKVLRYKESGLRKRGDWEQTWEAQRQEDAIDTAVTHEHPRQGDESDSEWEARLKSERARRKREQIGDIPAPPKYTGADFLSGTIKRLRGDLDVPKERFFTVPRGDTSGEWLYGWAGWSPTERVRAIAGTYTDASTRKGWSVPQLIPLLAAIEEELPWVLQWHNDVDPEFGVRLGDFFREQLSRDLHTHGLTREDLANWRPEGAGRGLSRRAEA